VVVKKKIVHRILLSGSKNFSLARCHLAEIFEIQQGWQFEEGPSKGPAGARRFITHGVVRKNGKDWFLFKSRISGSVPDRNSCTSWALLLQGRRLPLGRKHRRKKRTSVS
jgi:hypothetical protein